MFLLAEPDHLHFSVSLAHRCQIKMFFADLEMVWITFVNYSIIATVGPKV